MQQGIELAIGAQAIYGSTLIGHAGLSVISEIWLQHWMDTILPTEISIVRNNQVIRPFKSLHVLAA